MTYDLVDHRDIMTGHHTSIKGSRFCVRNYIRWGLDPWKALLGLAFHARWFATAQGQVCQSKVGIGYFSIKFESCRMARLQDADGNDLGMSGIMSFDDRAYSRPPRLLTESLDGTCGFGTKFRCPGLQCCSQYGFW